MENIPINEPIYKKEIDTLDYYIEVERKYIKRNKEELKKIKNKRNNRILIKKLKEEIKWREDNLHAHLKDQEEIIKKIKKENS